MEMTEGLARQLSVILPALGIAVSVQIQAVHRQIKSKREEAAEAVKKAKRSKLKFPDDSAEARLIRQNHIDRIAWGIVGVTAYLYAAIVVTGEVQCLRWLANDRSGNSEGTAIFLSCLALIGFCAVLLIPAARLIESVWRGHIRASRDMRDYEALPNSPPEDSGNQTSVAAGSGPAGTHPCPSFELRLGRVHLTVSASPDGSSP